MITNSTTIHPLFTQSPSRALWDYISLSERICWSKELIRRYADSLSWYNLSANTNLPWDRELVEEFEDRWDWRALSAILANWPVGSELEAFLDRHSGEVEWGRICEGSGITPSIVAKHTEHINWSVLSYNPQFSWSLGFVEEYEELIDWDAFSDVLAVQLHKWPGVNIGDFLNTYKDLINWNSLSHLMEFSVSPQLLVELGEFWDWNGIAFNRHFEWTEETVRLVSKFVDGEPNYLNCTYMWHCLGREEYNRFVLENSDFEGR